MEIHQIIKRPLITEKTMLLTQEGKYTFIVDVKATKAQVKKAIGDFFEVKVLKVWLSKVTGKSKRTGRLRRHWTKKPDFKKAIVKLSQGEKIDLFEELSRREGRGSSTKTSGKKPEKKKRKSAKG
jgi:large subunit ribosomal protein L23